MAGKEEVLVNRLILVLPESSGSGLGLTESGSDPLEKKNRSEPNPIEKINCFFTFISKISTKTILFELSCYI